MYLIVVGDKMLALIWNAFLLPIVVVGVVFLLQAYFPKFQNFIFTKTHKRHLLIAFSFVLLYSACYLAKYSTKLSFFPFYGIIVLLLMLLIWLLQLYFLKRIVQKVYCKLLFSILFILNGVLYVFFIILFIITRFQVW